MFFLHFNSTYDMNTTWYSFIRIYILNIYIEVFIIIHTDFIIRLYLVIYISRFTL